MDPTVATFCTGKVRAVSLPAVKWVNNGSTGLSTPAMQISLFCSKHECGSQGPNADSLAVPRQTNGFEIKSKCRAFKLNKIKPFRTV
jgi:hypothetical protein